MLTSLENKNLLVESMLGNKNICSGETQFGPFIKKLNLAIKEDVATESRRHNKKSCCSKWISLNYMKRDIESRLRPNEIAPCDK